MWAPPLIYIYIYIYIIKEKHIFKLVERFYFFYFLLLLSSIYGNRTVGIRRGKNEKALLDEGYAWEPKTRDFAEFSIKNSKNSIFWFFLDLQISDDQNWSEQKVKLQEVWI